ncbi:hypothetical protein HN51_017186 [Arachis hypogaea]
MLQSIFSIYHKNKYTLTTTFLIFFFFIIICVFHMARINSVLFITLIIVIVCCSSFLDARKISAKMGTKDVSLLQGTLPSSSESYSSFISNGHGNGDRVLVESIPSPGAGHVTP